MQNSSLLRSFSFALAFAGAAAAQAIPFDPNIGLPLGAGDDAVIIGNPLGFTFIFPNGSGQTAIDIDTNGRIFPPGADTSDGTETFGELLGQTTSLCAFWDDLDPSNAGADDIYFNAYNNGSQNKAVITWKDVVQYDWHGRLAYTFQIQLFDDSRFVFCYDARCPIDEPLVGISQGGGAINPGAVNFNGAPMLNSGTTATMFEDFALRTFDLQGSSLEFIINGTGGYLCNYRSSPARAEPFGLSRTTGLNFAPAGGGTYNVTHVGPSSFDPVFGTQLLNTGDEVFAASRALGFSFTWPGGTSFATVDVDLNGRLVPPGSDATEFAPTVVALLSETHPSISPLNNDYDLGNTAIDGIYEKLGTGFATFTWDRVTQYRMLAPITFQCTLRADGSFTFAYQQTTSFVDGAGQFGSGTTPAGFVMVGFSSGNGAVDPGPSNFAAGNFTTAGPTAYQYWTAADTLDLQFRLLADTRPLLNSSYDLRMHAIPPGTSGAFLMIGFGNLNTGPLDAIGMPSCWLYSSNNIPAVPIPFIGTTSLTASIAIPPSTSNLGLPLVLQGATITPGISSLPVVTSNAVVGTVGNL